MESAKIFFGIVWNKYIITISVFIVFMLFFDTNSFIAHRKLNKELSKVLEEKKFYTDQIISDKKRAEELMSNDENLEKFAREHYLMKKDNEDVYLLLID
ncbi:MAG: septum formation inhibitor [Bacteroidales bacterium]|nr:septum formation inhibitor [Bacteroidales bacterium]